MSIEKVFHNVESVIRTINGTEQSLIDARSLHAVLKEVTQFDLWIKPKINYLGYKEGISYLVETRERFGRKDSIEYYVNVPMATTLVCISRTEVAVEHRNLLEKEYYEDIEQKRIKEEENLQLTDQLQTAEQKIAEEKRVKEEEERKYAEWRAARVKLTLERLQNVIVSKAPCYLGIKDLDVLSKRLEALKKTLGFTREDHNLYVREQESYHIRKDICLLLIEHENELLTMATRNKFRPSDLFATRAWAEKQFGVEMPFNYSR